MQATTVILLDHTSHHSDFVRLYRPPIEKLQKITDFQKKKKSKCSKNLKLSKHQFFSKINQNCKKKNPKIKKFPKTQIFQNFQKISKLSKFSKI